VEYLYCVAKNGAVPVRKIEVLKETKKQYVLNNLMKNRVLKSTMANKFCSYFVDEKQAQEYYNWIKRISSKTVFDSIRTMRRDEMAELLTEVRLKDIKPLLKRVGYSEDEINNIENKTRCIMLDFLESEVAENV
jgi:hypothetical protein